MTRTIAIRLKIPDNEAYTALTVLRRLGVDVAHVERADIWQMEDKGDAHDFKGRVRRDETLFNPNKHELDELESGRPRPGEVWIAALAGGGGASLLARGVAGVASAQRFKGWRLFAQGHSPADDATVKAAVERLLCNPAIERAIMR